MNKIKKGDIVFRKKSEILLLVFKDKRVIKMISTIHSAEMVPTGRQDRKTKENIMKPLCITEYNKFMKGVDRLKKWTKKTVLYSIKIATEHS